MTYNIHVDVSNKKGKYEWKQKKTGKSRTDEVNSNYPKALEKT